jgi:hypothetical protein
MPLPDLTDQFVAQSYKGVLHTSNEELLAASPKQVYDGVGNSSAMKLGGSGEGVEISGDVVADNFRIVIGSEERSLIDYIYPIGSVYFSVDPPNPVNKFPGTTWTQISQGRFIVGVGTGTDTSTATKEFILENNGGIYDTTLTEAQLPPHNHLHGVLSQHPTYNPNIYGATQTDTPTSSSGDYRPLDTLDAFDNFNTRKQGFTSNTGGGASFTNLPPSFGLYIWKRTS